MASPVLALAHTPSFVGVEKGLFLKHGLDLKLKILGSGPEVAKAMQAGEIQFGAAAYSNHPIALERGFKGKMVVGVIGDATSLFYDENLAVVARPGSGIKSPEDLAGKKVGLVVGGTGDEYLRALLKKRNVLNEQFLSYRTAPVVVIDRHVGVEALLRPQHAVGLHGDEGEE